MDSFAWLMPLVNALRELTLVNMVNAWCKSMIPLGECINQTVNHRWLINGPLSLERGLLTIHQQEGST